MAGGIYVQRPFSLNIKCVVFALAMMALYVVSSGGRPNYLMLPFIFVVSYVAMAWYDVAYNCSDQLQTGVSGPGGVLDSIFKNQRRGITDPDAVLDQESVYQKNVYLFHLLIIAPLMIYIGFIGYRGQQVKPEFFAILIAVGVGAVIYHGMRMIYPRQTCNIIVQNDTDATVTKL